MSVGFEWVHGPRYTAVMSWILISTLAGAVAAMLIIPAVMDYRHWTLGQHGVHASAVVIAVEPGGRSPDYLLQVELPDAAPLQEWTSNVQAGTVVGQQITVIVDPQDPENLRDLRVYDTAALWLLPLISLPFAGVMAWFLRGAWRDRPTRRDLAALSAVQRSRSGGGLVTRLAVRDGTVASGYPDPLTFVVALRHRARMLWGALISALPLAGPAITGHGANPIGVIIFGGLAALIAGLFLAFGRNRVILDQTGIRNRWLLRSERRHAWAEIVELQNWTGARSRGIRVVPRHGKPFMLAAPFDAPPGSPDPQFDHKAVVIAQYWRDARRGRPPRHDTHPHRRHDGRPDKPFDHHGQ